MKNKGHKGGVGNKLGVAWDKTKGLFKRNGTSSIAAQAAQVPQAAQATQATQATPATPAPPVPIKSVTEPLSIPPVPLNTPEYEVIEKYMKEKILNSKVVKDISDQTGKNAMFTNILNSLVKGSSRARTIIYMGTAMAAVILLVSTILWIHAARKIHGAYQLGTRLQQECGNRYLERNTGRFAAYQAYTRYAKLMNVAQSLCYTSVFLLFFSMLSVILMTILQDKVQIHQTYIRVTLAIIFGILSVGYISIFIWKAVEMMRTLWQLRVYTTDTETQARIDEQKKQTMMMLLPSLLVIIGMIFMYFRYDHIRKQVAGDAFPLWIALYAFLFFFLFILSKDVGVLSAEINAKYKTKIQQLQTALETLRTDETLGPIMNRDLVINIKANEMIPVEGEGDVVLNNAQFKDVLWSYVAHEGGNELSDMYSTCS